MKKNITLKDKMRYAFENTLSKGTIALIIWLAIFSFVIVCVAGLIFVVTGIAPEGEKELGFFEATWQSLMRTLDAGTMGGDAGWSYRFIMFAVTIGGIFIISSLIGILTSGLESKLEEMRKGRSMVLESHHTLILGWSSKIIPIISELIVANTNQKKPRIVIMAEKDKVEMEDEIRDKISDFKNTKIICRTGNPIDITDLEIVNPHQAKSIIILSPEDKNGDISAIKSVMAITNNPKRKKEKYHIVAEIQNNDNMEAARLVGGDEAVYVQSADFIARLTAQTCRQSGLSVIYTELLDFGGDEIYFKHEPSLKGKTFKEVLFMYDTSALMGIMRANGNVMINPPMDTVLEENDQIIVVAFDDDKITLNNKTTFTVDQNAISSKVVTAQKIEKNLILGWNEKAEMIIRELDRYVSKGSEVTVIAEAEDIEDHIDHVQKYLKNQDLHFIEGDITKREVLDKIDICTFNDVIILGYNNIDIQEADAKTLIALLHIRNITNEKGKDFNVVSEMYDIKNRELAEVTKADDFIISDKIISLMMSQLSENKNLKKVFDDLFEAEGSEIYLKPASNYIKEGSTVDFYTILESAAQKGEIALGYKLNQFAHDAEKAYGVKINPLKTEKVTLLSTDKIIVIAQD